MTARRKVDAPLKHRIVTLSGLGELTQAEIATRVGLVSTTTVALNRVSRRTVSTLCQPYRQKKMEKEELFTLSDVKMMMGLKGNRRIVDLARREGIGQLFARHRVYSREDVDKLLSLLGPPAGKMTGEEVRSLFKVGRDQWKSWQKLLALQPERRFGVCYFSQDDVRAVRGSLALSKLGLTVKRLAYSCDVDYQMALAVCKRKKLGSRAVSRLGSQAFFLAQGEYEQAWATLSLLRRQPAASSPSESPLSASQSGR